MNKKSVLVGKGGLTDSDIINTGAIGISAYTRESGTFQGEIGYGFLVPSLSTTAPIISGGTITPTLYVHSYCTTKGGDGNSNTASVNYIIKAK